MTDTGIRIETRGPAGLVVAAGEIDLSVAPELERAIRDGAARRFVIVDLADVSFIDSTGLRALVAGRESLESDGRSMALVAGDAVARLLSLTALDRDFAVFDSLDSALAAG
jgi:anti-sigma B factor antagonist